MKNLLFVSVFALGMALTTSSAHAGTQGQTMFAAQNLSTISGALANQYNYYPNTYNHLVALSQRANQLRNVAYYQGRFQAGEYLEMYIIPVYYDLLMYVQNIPDYGQQQQIRNAVRNALNHLVSMITGMQVFGEPPQWINAPYNWDFGPGPGPIGPSGTGVPTIPGVPYVAPNGGLNSGAGGVPFNGSSGSMGPTLSNPTVTDDWE